MNAPPPPFRQSIFRRLARRVRHWLPRWESSLVLGRPIVGDERVTDRPGITRVTWVERESDPDAPDLYRFSHACQGMDEAWCRLELWRGLVIVLAWADDPAGGAQRIVATAWTTPGEHWVDDVYHYFDPGPVGCQLLNAFVHPDFRGKRIQQMLVERRLDWAWRRGKRWAYTVIHTWNAPSLKNNVAAGFRPVVRVDLVRVGRLKLTFVRRVTHRIPPGGLRFRGWPASLYAHVVRDRPAEEKG